jgi:hypothetical protein
VTFICREPRSRSIASASRTPSCWGKSRHPCSSRRIKPSSPSNPDLELNGRTTRLFIDLIAVLNGYGPVDYGASLDDGEPNGYIRASIACVQRADTEPLRQIILSGLRKADDPYHHS